MRFFAVFLPGCLLVPALLGGAPVPEARYAHLARGVNLTRWFQYGSPLKIGEADRNLLRNAGFTAVRIPVAPQYLLSRWASPTQIAQTLDRLDRGIDLFLNAGMAVDLDFHADAGYLNYYFATPGAADELAATWKMLATRYAGRSRDLLFFEIMNEPDTRFTQAAWDRVQTEVLAAIRSVAPDRTVLLAPAAWSGLDALLQMKPYSDQNAIYVLHYYSPTKFTHQGATWVDGQPELALLRGVPWPAFLPEPEPADAAATERLARYQAEDWDRGHIDWDMGLAARWARRWNVRVIVNEFGAYKPNASPESRTRWLRDVRTAIERNKLDWAVWDYAAGFDVTKIANDARMVDPDAAAALGLMPPTQPDPDPVRTGPLPPFNGPRTIQIGAQPAISSGPAAISAAAWPEVVVTSYRADPVELFTGDGDGTLEAEPFDGPAPVAANAPIVAGHFDRSGRAGFFFPGQPSKLALPSGKTLRAAADDLPAARAAATLPDHGVDDLVLFGDRTRLLHNDGSGGFRETPGAFPPETGAFACGVVAKGRLNAFGPGTAQVFRSRGHDRFAKPRLLPTVHGEGDCTAIAADGLVIVAWTNGALQILKGGRDETARRIGVLPAAKHGLRGIALSGGTLAVLRAGEPPLIYSEKRGGTFMPVALKPADNLSVAAPADLNGDGITDLIYAQGGNAPLLGRFGQR